MHARRRKKERKMNKIEMFMFCMAFSNLLKVSGVFRVDLAIEYQRDVVCRLFSSLCFVFLRAAPIPYAQAAILNLPHRSTIILLDMELWKKRKTRRLPYISKNTQQM